MPIPGLLASLQGAVASEASWVGPTIALALIVLDIAFVIIAVVAVVTARRALRATLELERAAEAGRGLMTRVQEEVGEVIRTSQRVRFEVDRGVRRARRRLQDLDAVAEVVQEEIEETALDLAASLRTVRTGGSVVSRITRLLRGRR